VQRVERGRLALARRARLRGERAIERADRRVVLPPVARAAPVGTEHLVAVLASVRTVAPVKFLDDDQELGAGTLDRHDGAAPGPQGGGNVLTRESEFRGIELATTNNDRVLDATRDGEPAVAHESQVAGPQVRLRRRVGEPRVERLRRLRGAPPVAARDARPVD